MSFRETFSGLLEKLISKKGNLTLIVPPLLFFIIWSYVLLQEFRSFNITIFDYGVAYNLLWRESYGVTSLPSTVGYLPYVDPRKLISFLLIPYLRFFPSVTDLLILQAFVLTIPAVVLYLITLKITSNRKIAFLIECMWLLYYPNSAAIDYPFHYQTIFPIFYVLGFFFLFKGRKVLSAISLSLSAFTSLLAPIIIIFSVPVILSVNERFVKITSDPDKKFNQYHLILIIALVSFSILALNFIFEGTSFFVSQAIPTGDQTANVPIYFTLIEKFLHISGLPGIYYIIFLSLPLLLSLFLEWRFFLAGLPAIAYYLVGYSGGGLRFFYPMQYSVLLSPMVFLSFILIIDKVIGNRFYLQICEKKNITKFIKSFLSVENRKVASGILLSALIINISLFSVYSPIGPLNQYLNLYPNAAPPSNGGYNLNGQINYSVYDANLMKLVNLVPNNASVLSQFNMPQFSNRFYFTYPGQYNPIQPIDYAINDPANQYLFQFSVYDTGSDFFPFNMMQISNMFLHNSSYGVYGESMGAILFKHGYVGPLKIYIPLNETLYPTQVSLSRFATPTVILCPGTYNLILGQYSNEPISIYIDGILYSTVKSYSLNTTLNIPEYMYTNITIEGGNSPKTLRLEQTVPAHYINLNKNIPTPSDYGIFKSNLSSYTPLTKSNISLQTGSFSYMFLINLTSFEDGSSFPIDLPNDAQVFSLYGKYDYIWVQIENTGYLEFGFRSQNNGASSYIQPINIVTNKWYAIVATISNNTANIFIDGHLIFSGNIFNNNMTVGHPSYMIIGGAHPFLQENGIPYSNSNPLNASLSNFVLINGTLPLSFIENFPNNFTLPIFQNKVIFSKWRGGAL